MPLTPKQSGIHLLWRAGFGPAAAQLRDLEKTSLKHLTEQLFSASAGKSQDYRLVDEALIARANDKQMLRSMMNKEDRKQLRIKNLNSIKQINLTWLSDMAESEAQLREKAAFFWHGHFACRSLNAIHQQALLNVIRRNALGNFSTLLHEVSKTAAMLNFLNNNQNRKDHPNENFAREVMELFTLGRGFYTETDVKEAARAFTGWGADPAGNFIFRKQRHDTGKKTILGKTGNFNGDDVLEILLEQKQTARFIVQKLYRFYINDHPDPEQVNDLAETFYENHYDLTVLLRKMFASVIFFDPANIGIRFKSPIELLTGIQRMLPMKILNPDVLIVLQRVLGQVLLYPPNVAGWPGGKSWIDSSTLMMRMHLPGLINDTSAYPLQPKDDDDQMMGRKEEDKPESGATATGKKQGKRRKLSAVIDWEKYITCFEGVPRSELIKSINSLLLRSTPAVPDALISQHADASSRESFIKSATLRIMGLPEYQLC